MSKLDPAVEALLLKARDFIVETSGTAVGIAMSEKHPNPDEVLLNLATRGMVVAHSIGAALSQPPAPAAPVPATGVSPAQVYQALQQYVTRYPADFAEHLAPLARQIAALSQPKAPEPESVGRPAPDREKAVEAVVAAARKMSRETPAPGGAATVHRFGIAAGVVWQLDKALLEYDAALSASPAAPKEG